VEDALTLRIAVGNPADELVDVLDDAGQVIGRATRREMRGRRLPHRCVYLLVFNSRGDVFVHQRTATKDVFPSYWDLTVGGVVAAGESFDDAALREGREELGVDLQPRLLFPFRYDGEHSIAFGMVYSTTHDGPFLLQAEEITGGEFVSVHDLPVLTARERFCPDGVQVWAEFQRRNCIL
jgi:isopentenyldiphosphate isomerase